ncbi:hypothetical protein [Segetibacter aerophilus]|nr:hypothetical protein [Segetibacter aerophilus]
MTRHPADIILDHILQKDHLVGDSIICKETVLTAALLNTGLLKWKD